MKLVIALTAAVALALPALAHADDPANKNGSPQAKPQSSAAATPESDKHSADTVGAMKNAEGGSFTAPEADKKKDMLKSK